jgi:hypothetical protein
MNRHIVKDRLSERPVGSRVDVVGGGLPAKTRAPFGNSSTGCAAGHAKRYPTSSGSIGLRFWRSELSLSPIGEVVVFRTSFLNLRIVPCPLWMPDDLPTFN